LTNRVFDSEKFLKIEANRLQGRPDHLTLVNGNTVGLIARQIPDTIFSDLVSVYGYPDQIERSGVCQTEDEPLRLLQNLAEEARTRGLVSGYVRLGLGSEMHLPSCREPTFISHRTKVAEVVAVDLLKDPDVLMSEYRKKLRYDLKKANRLVIERSVNFSAFHAIYSENMARVGAAEHYFFDENYLSSLGQIEGVELWLAYDESDVVAGGLFIEQGQNIFYHLGATADRALGRSPLKYLLHNRILNLAKSGPKKLILGGGIGGGDDPLMRFKRGFSQLTVPVHALKIVFDIQAYSKLSGQSAIDLSEPGFFPGYRSP